jgi:hypothetical protein
MSAVDDIRKVLQDILAPEMAALKERITAVDKIAAARWEAEQAQYATMMTNMELIKEQMRNNHIALLNKLEGIASVFEESLRK